MAIVETVRPGTGAIKISNQGVWFGPRSRPLAGWLTEPASGVGTSAVVVAPPTGYAYACSHRPLRQLAFALAQAGHAVLRFDYDGTGDSAGDQWDPARIDAWGVSLALAITEMRDRGATSVTLVGARLGATMALLEARTLGVERVVAWLPVARGRRYSKEVRLLSETVPEREDPEGRPDTRVVAGSVFSKETTAAISALSLFDLDRAPANAVLVIDDAAGNATDSVERLRSLGADVDHVMLAQAEEALETPPEYAADCEEVVAAAMNWIGPPPPAAETGADRGVARPAGRRQAGLAWRGAALAEEFVELDGGRAGVLTRPAAGVDNPNAATLVLLNPGAETHIGPGRAWVEIARGLALAGRETLRVDMGGGGETADPGGAPGLPYDPDAVAETLALAAALRSLGRQRIAVAGLCAGAWIGLDAARSGELDGVVAINPQLYWQQGDPVEIDWDVIRRRRAAEIRIVENGARAGLWDQLAALGARNRVADWLQELTDLPTRIELVFAERDDGVVFLEQRLGRRFTELRESGEIGVQELPGVDHPMHLTWLRPRMLDAIEAALCRIDVSGATLATS